MKMCQPHWNDLREEVEQRRGLEQFVARSGKEVASRMVDELRGDPSPGDPLMTAHNMILSVALDRYGPWLFGTEEDGTDRCPLCIVDKPCNSPECVNCGPGTAAKWIGFAGRDVAELWASRMKAAEQ